MSLRSINKPATLRQIAVTRAATARRKFPYARALIGTPLIPAGIRSYATDAPNPNKGRNTLAKSAATGVAFGFAVAFARDLYNRQTSGPDVSCRIGQSRQLH